MTIGISASMLSLCVCVCVYIYTHPLSSRITFIEKRSILGIMALIEDLSDFSENIYIYIYIYNFSLKINLEIFTDLVK